MNQSAILVHKFCISAIGQIEKTIRLLIFHDWHMFGFFSLNVFYFFFFFKITRSCTVPEKRNEKRSTWTCRGSAVKFSHLCILLEVEELPIDGDRMTKLLHYERQ